MIVASQLRGGMAIRYEGQLYKVISADYHPGQGKMGGVTHVRLRNLSTGTLWEHSFRSDLKIEDLALEKRPVDFLYRDGDDCYFMDPETYEQFVVPAAVIGEQANFLRPEMRVPVEFLDDRPVSVQMPDFLEVRIEDTAPPSHQVSDGPWKPATVEGGVEIMVPPFIKTGDVIRLDLGAMKYMDRVKAPPK